FNWNIYTYDLTTKKERQISAFHWNEFMPAWMKRGSGVLYALRAEKSTFIIHGKTSGADFKQITLKNNEAFYPDISPDGRMLAYQSYTGNNWEIFTLKLTEKFPESSRKQLTHTSRVNETRPLWSPDGRRILFIANYRNSNDYDLYMMSYPDGVAAPLTAKGNIAPEYVWSPDGTRIAYTSHASGHGDIFIVETDGGKKIPVAVTAADERFPVWSPDGNYIAFLRRRGNNYYLFSAAASGADAPAAEPDQLSSIPCYPEPIVWFSIDDVIF
ncbi:MAG: hypothetical protein AB1546_05420, partial [bacterium]